jgi:hypothetical protein
LKPPFDSVAIDGYSAFVVLPVVPIMFSRALAAVIVAGYCYSVT